MLGALYDDGTACKVATPFPPFLLPLSVGGLTKPIKYVPVRVGEIAAALQTLSPKQLPIPSDIVLVGPPTLSAKLSQIFNGIPKLKSD